MDKGKICTTIAIFITMIILGNLSVVDGLKPEIQHKFRQPEKRPPILLITFFTILVASPALILFKFWSKTVSVKFTITLRRAIFHLIFLLILCSYIRFWLGTNMFDTIRLTVPLTFALFYVFK